MSTVHIILLRGLARTARHWGNLPDYLQESASPVHISSFDLPGFGKRAHLPSPLSIEGNIPDLHEQMVAIEQGFSAPPERRILVGYSLGGMIAHAWAQREPALFSDVILINSSLAALSPFWKRMQLGAAAQFFCSAAMPLTVREQMILRVIANDPQGRADAVPAWIAIAKEQPFTVANVFRQLVAALGYRPINIRLHSNIRVHVAASRADRLCDAACSAALAKALAAPLQYHDHGGHDLAIDDPQWLANFILRTVNISA